MAEQKTIQIDESTPVETVKAEDADVVDAEVVETPESTETAEAKPSEQDAAPIPARDVIFVDAPTPPRRKGNRIAAVLLAFPATLVFLVLLGVFQYVVSGGDVDFLRSSVFYYPGLLLFLGIVLLGAALNRAAWWTHIFASVLVGVLVWLGSASLALLSGGMFGMTQPQANEFFYGHLFSANSIIAALLAREVAIWTGAALARRGRVLRIRNAEAQAAFEKEQADLLNLGR